MSDWSILPCITSAAERLLQVPLLASHFFLPPKQTFIGAFELHLELLCTVSQAAWPLLSESGGHRKVCWLLEFYHHYLLLS